MFSDGEIWSKFHRENTFSCGMEETEKATLTFVLHGGFTDALFRKWLAICRDSETRFASYRASALCIYNTRVFSLFPSHSASVYRSRALRHKINPCILCRPPIYYSAHRSRILRDIRSMELNFLRKNYGCTIKNSKFIIIISELYQMNEREKNLLISFLKRAFKNICI